MRLFFKLACAALLTCAIAPSLNAFIFDRGNEYECSCEPLYCGSWGVQLQGGVRPITWLNRGSLSLVNCTVTPALPAVSLVGKIPNYTKLYKLPWQIGGQLSYAFSPNTNIFTEVNYAQSHSKSAAVFNGSSLSLIGLSKYRLIDWYVGTRYYFDRMCDQVSFFVGGKIGLVHHKTSSASALSAAVASDCCNFADLFVRNTVFAGGGHVGVDICYCGNISWVITAEVVACSGPNSGGDVLLTSAASTSLGLATDLLVGNIQTELAFPITVGVKYNF